MISLAFAGLHLASSGNASAQQSSSRRHASFAAPSADNHGDDRRDAGVQTAGALSTQNNSFDPVYGIRSADAMASPLQPNAIGFNNRGLFATFNKNQPTGNAPQLNIYHQPLIQIKLRIIEVVREDNLAAKTVLDYIRDHNNATRINDHNINQNRNRTTTSTRFPDPALVGTGLTGSGGIVNVTSGHLNLIGEFLATEFKSDLITCPQVVTLNGQRVQLVSGANVPFVLGQTVIHDNTLAVQETFYKHVGTNLTITPRIINWGPHGQGMGQRPITSREIKDWNAVARMMVSESLLYDDEERQTFRVYTETDRLMTIEHQHMLLDSLNRHDRASLIALLTSRQQTVPGYRYLIDDLFHSLECGQINADGCPCDWEPSDCTLDIEVVLRQSAPGATSITDLASEAARPRPNAPAVSVIAEEEVGAGISDVVQLKSGHGAVIAGLIGERDIEVVSKVPVLGDIPWVGAAFRSNLTNRQKTEIVIFLEAEVLPSDPLEALPTAARDYALTRSYLNQDVLCNPLECAMQRAGFGSYLPPRSFHEKVYWERLGRKVQKASTDIGDIVH